MVFFFSIKQVDYNMTINNETLSSIEIEPSQTAKRSTIWLHGLGADGHDFQPIVPELNSSFRSDMRFIFPHAPIIPVTINGGYAMRAWYDIYAPEINAKVDKAGIMQSVAHIEKLIAREVARGIATQDIFLAGFSQGAAIALVTGLCHAQPLAGIIALSGYLPLANELQQLSNPNNQSTPIFQAHGTQDPIVPLALGNMTHEWLIKAGYSVTWRNYPMPHSVCAEEMNDISLWYESVLGIR